MAKTCGLSANYGVFAVLGNHDGWYNDEIVTRELEKAGIVVLDNKCKVLQINGKPLRLLGLKDHMKVTSWKWFSAEAAASLATCGPEGDVIALEHSPDVLPMITGDLAYFQRPQTHSCRTRTAGVGCQLWGYPVCHLRSDKNTLTATLKTLMLICL